MNNEIQIFEYMQSQQFRTVTIENEVWFVVADVCKILGVSNPRDAISDIDDEDKNTVAITDGIRGNPNMNVISEHGLYELIIKSRKPDAKKFKHWIFHEVIPSVMRNGYYIDKTAVAKSPEKMDRLVDDVATIRVNERVFFAKVKQYFTMATDYDPNNKRMQAFFAVIQNRFLFAVTGHTACEIVIDKIDHDKERCGMVQDVPVTKANLAISKNYLDQIDLQQLINLCNLYLHCLESIKIRDRKVTTEYLMSFFDQLLRDLQYQVMNGQDHPSCKQRDRIVQREYNLYKQIAIEDRQPQLQGS